MGIKNILLDIDDTLLDFKRSEKSALTKTLIHLGIEPTDEIIALYSKTNAEQWKLLEKGLITRDEVRFRRYSLFFDAIDVDRDPRAAGEYYESKLSLEHHMVDGAAELLETLFGKYRLYIVSNGHSHVQRSRIKCADIEKYFDGVFISQEIGYAKPKREFFDACFSAIPDFSADETVIVGDSLSSDILGGKNVGITTVWYNPRGEDCRDTVPDHQVRSLDEIPDLVAGIRVK